MRLRTSHLTLVGALALGVLAGCGNQDPTLFSPNQTPSATFEAAAAPAQLVFISRTYDYENDQTTFLYQLQSTIGASSETGTVQDLSGVLGVFTNVMVELPSCAPAPDSYFPTDGATIFTNPNGIYGIQWGVGYDENPDYMYSITFPGDVPQGVVRGLVETGGFTYIQDIAGPCDGTYSITGTLFGDTDGDGSRGFNEFGIPDVTITLDGSNGTQEIKTDSDGHYVFIVVAGDYTVHVDSMTTASDFNETLFQTWNQTTATSFDITVGPSSGGNDFGFEPDISIIIAGLNAGTYPTDGKSYKWWRKEIQRAITGNGPTTYTAAELIAFIQQIDALAILQQYDFTPGMELEQALAILDNHAFGDDTYNDKISTEQGYGRHDVLAALQRELLTTELNHVSGRGLYDKTLQAALINWGEGIVVGNTAPAIIFPGDDPNIIRDPLDETLDLYRGINGATGGGGTN